MAILGNITDKQYNEMDETRNSDLGEVKKSYAHYKNRKNKHRTDNMIFGSAFHTYLLDGVDEFFKSYHVLPEGFERRSNANKDLWQNILDSGMDPIKYEDYLAIQKMKENVMKHPTASKIMKTSENEGAYTGELCGLPAKCKIDVRSRGYSFDVKSCQDASLDGFRKSINNFNYHRQGAFYDEILLQNDIKSKGFGFIAVESEEPHFVGVYLLGEKSMIAGMAQVERLVKKLVKYKNDDTLWDGYSGDIEPIDISGWKSKEEEDCEDSHTGE